LKALRSTLSNVAAAAKGASSEIHDQECQVLSLGAETRARNDQLALTAELLACAAEMHVLAVTTTADALVSLRTSTGNT